MNILLIGHACGPGLGSEPGNTWNWAQCLSAKHQVWVIAYPQHQLAVERYLAQNPNPNLHFIWVTTNHPLDPWKPERGQNGIRIHYMLWLPRAYKKAAELCSEAPIDVAHHVSLGTLSAPPPLWRLSVPTIWGPIGGGQVAPARYLKLFGRQKWPERIRTARVKALRFSPALRKTARLCDAVFATNRDTANILTRAGGRRVEMLLDCGLPEICGPETAPDPMDLRSEFTLLWAGRLITLKALPLALHALARVADPRVRLKVAGEGPEEAELKCLAGKLGIQDRVTFLGKVPYEKMPELFDSASAFLFTSLRDSFGSVVLEAMAHALPVITLDHQGVGTFLPEEASIKVTVSSPDETIAGLARAIEDLASSKRALGAMRSAAWRFAKGQTWRRRAAAMSDIYETLVKAHLQSFSLVSS